MQPMTKPKFLAAALISPWAAPVIVVVGSILVSGTWPLHYELPVTVSFTVIVSYVGFFAIGLPLIYVLRRAGYLNFLTLLVGGALAGVAVFFFFTKVLGFLLTSSASFGALQLVWGAVLGFGVACLFGLIAGIRRGSGPKNSEQPTNK